MFRFLAAITNGNSGEYHFVVDFNKTWLEFCLDQEAIIGNLKNLTISTSVMVENMSNLCGDNIKKNDKVHLTIVFQVDRDDFKEDIETFIRSKLMPVQSPLQYQVDIRLALLCVSF